METDRDELSEELGRKICSFRDGETYWLGIAGPPGSGKSTLAEFLASRFGGSAVVIPMDGYHLYRSALDGMPDPAEAHLRRGAPFTFDAARFVRELRLARETGAGEFPSFDHHRGDPVEKEITLDRGRHRLVIVEGNYLLLDDDPWKQLGEVFDETWYLDVDLGLCLARVKSRLMGTGLDEEEARHRVERNDRLNAELIASSGRAGADRVIRLPEFPGGP